MPARPMATIFGAVAQFATCHFCQLNEMAKLRNNVFAAQQAYSAFCFAAAFLTGRGKAPAATWRYNAMPPSTRCAWPVM